MYIVIDTNIRDKGDMMKNDRLHELIQKNNGILYASIARAMGIDNTLLQRMEESGELERIGRGMYIDADYMRDEYLLAQYRCRKGSFSHETALFFHELSDSSLCCGARNIQGRSVRESKTYQYRHLL